MVPPFDYEVLIIHPHKQNFLLLLEVQTTSNTLSGKLKWEKISSRFEGCYENALIQSFEMRPHLIVWILNPQPLLWPALLQTRSRGWP